MNNTQVAQTKFWLILFDLVAIYSIGSFIWHRDCQISQFEGSFTGRLRYDKAKRDCY